MANPPGDLSALLEALAAGEDVDSRQFALLSDLGTADREQLRAAWPRVPGDARCTVFNEVAALSEANIELDFTQLARIGLRDTDPVVRRLAIEASAESDDRGIATELTRLLGDEDSEVRFSAAEGLAHFVLLREYEQFEETQGDEIVQALRERATDGSEEPGVRARALVSLSGRAADFVDPLIMECYYSEDRILRLGAVEAMGATAEDRWLEYIDEQLISEDPEFRFQAVASAAEIASPDSIESVAPLLDDPDEDVVLGAVAALGEIAGPEAVEYLEDFKRRMPDGFAVAVDAALEEARNPWRSKEEEEDQWDEDE